MSWIGRVVIASWLCSALVVTLPAIAAGADATPAAQRQAVLNSARVAFNDGNFSFAAERFHEFLRMAPPPVEAASAQYGLGLSLLEGPAKDCNAAVASFSAAVSVSDFPERPEALYYLATALRDVGTDLQQKATGKTPTEAAPLIQQGQERWTQATAHFLLAADAFVAQKRPSAVADAATWSARARCNAAELLIKLRQYRNAAAAVQPVLAATMQPDKTLREMALYYQGYANFGLRDFVAAGKSLSQLAPFNQPAVGLHARFLLARTHHLAGERPEALAQYEETVKAFTAQRVAAIESLKAPSLKPEDKLRLQELVSVPDWIARAMFYDGVLLEEMNRPADAFAQFTACLQSLPQSSVAADAQLHLGTCLYQTKHWPEAIKTLASLQQHPRLGEEALRWLARAQVSSTDPNLLIPATLGALPTGAQISAHADSLLTAAGYLKKACDRAVAAATAGDPEAKGRLAAVLMELGDMQRLAAQHKEAVASYAAAIQSAQTPAFAEQAAARHAIALQLAGQYAASDQACLAFQQKYPRSAMASEIALRYAENAVLAAYASGPAQAQSLYPQAIQRLEKVVATFPDTPVAIVARLNIATTLYQSGQYAQAAAMLDKIPLGERMGGLAAVSYLQADCLVRSLPEKVDDALAMAKTAELLAKAGEMFEAWGISLRNSPESVDAMVRSTYCRQRLAMMNSDPAERQRLLALASRTYAEHLMQFPSHPLAPVMTVELSRCAARLGNLAGANGILAQFQAEPLKNSPLAPFALTMMAENLRLAGGPQQAVALLAQLRTQYEQILLKDAARAELVPAMQWALALALKESGQWTAARDLFRSIATNYPKRPEAAEASWRVAQCEKDEAVRAFDAARQALAAAAPAARQQAVATVQQAADRLRQVAKNLATAAAALAQQQPDSAIALSMHYDAAWAWRKVADVEIAAARQKIQADAVAAFQARLAKEGANTSQPPVPNDVPLSAVPLQPAEQQARAEYAAILQLNDSAAISNDARLELAEVYLERDEHAPAITLLQQMLQGELPPELADRIRLRLGTACLVKNDFKGAHEAFDPIMQNAASPYAVLGRQAAAEVKFLQKDYAGAAQLLAPFIEGQPPRVAAGVPDRAILRLGQSYAQLGQWDNCRAAMEVFAARFPASSLVGEARALLGTALQNLKQYEPAVAAYIAAAGACTTETAARSLYQAGVCQLELKRPQDAMRLFQTVMYTYDYPESSAAAMCDAARAMVELKKPAEAARLLNRVMHEYPSGRWSEIARKRLSEIK